MSPIPLDQLGWRWRDHKAALWWLGLLYRRPDQFRQTLAGLSRSQGIFIGIRLWAHFLPYFVFVCVLGRLFVFGALGLPPSRPLGGPSDALYFHAMGDCRWDRRWDRRRDRLWDRRLGSPEGSPLGSPDGIAVGIAGGIAVGIGARDRRWDRHWDRRGIAVGIGILRSYYYPFHVVFVWPRIRPEWYPYHPVAWDNLCAIPFFKLDHLLVAYAERIPEHGIAEIERLIDSYPSQRLTALRARVRLLARESARMTDLTKLHALMAQLPEGERGFLSQTPQVREMVREITEIQIQIGHDRPPDLP